MTGVFSARLVQIRPKQEKLTVQEFGLRSLVGQSRNQQASKQCSIVCKEIFDKYVFYWCYTDIRSTNAMAAALSSDCGFFTPPLGFRNDSAPIVAQSSSSVSDSSP